MDDLGRLLAYMLGRRPDEFGLVPDSDGFVLYKELIQAIHEEPGWSYVRRSNINEVLLGKDRRLFEPEDNRIRSLERRWKMDMENPSKSLPETLFIAVRGRAHPVVMEKGLRSAGGRFLVLCPDKQMALRIGTRRDQRPVLLEVKADEAESRGILFYAFGRLFLSFEIPSEFIAGPPVPREVPEGRRDREVKRQKARPERIEPTPGTFVLDSSRDPDPFRRARGKKRKGWKEEARRLRKRRQEE